MAWHTAPDMSWFSRLLTSPKPPVTVAPPTSAPIPAKSPAEKRTYLLNLTERCAEFSSDYDRYPVPVTTEPEEYAVLQAGWQDDGGERCQTVRLRPDPASATDVLVQRGAITIGRLTPEYAVRYRELIEAVSALELTPTAAAKTLGGTPSRPQLRLMLSLDSPQTVAADFAISLKSTAPVIPPETTRPRSRKPKAQSDTLSADFPRHVAVVGESHYQDVLRRMFASSARVTVIIEGEPTNQYDKKAVRVANESGETLGYLAKGHYTELKALARLRARTCSADLRGGTPDRPSIGIVLDISDLR